MRIVSLPSSALMMAKSRRCRAQRVCSDAVPFQADGVLNDPETVEGKIGRTRPRKKDRLSIGVEADSWLVDQLVFESSLMVATVKRGSRKDEDRNEGTTRSECFTVTGRRVNDGGNQEHNVQNSLIHNGPGHHPGSVEVDLQKLKRRIGYPFDS